MGGKDLVATKQSKPNPTKPNRKAPRSEKPRETSLRAREPEMSIILALFARPPSNSLAGPTSKSGGGGRKADEQNGSPLSRMGAETERSNNDNDNKQRDEWTPAPSNSSPRLELAASAPVRLTYFRFAGRRLPCFKSPREALAASELESILFRSRWAEPACSAPTHDKAAACSASWPCSNSPAFVLTGRLQSEPNLFARQHL